MFAAMRRSGARSGALTVQLALAGLGSTFRRASRARTAKACAPGASPVYACGEVHAPNAALSRLHSKEPGSVAVKEKLASPLATVPVGADTSCVSGGCVSTPHV